MEVIDAWNHQAEQNVRKSIWSKKDQSIGLKFKGRVYLKRALSSMNIGGQTKVMYPALKTLARLLSHKLIKFGSRWIDYAPCRGYRRKWQQTQVFDALNFREEFLVSRRSFHVCLHDEIDSAEQRQREISKKVKNISDRTVKLSDLFFVDLNLVL